MKLTNRLEAESTRLRAENERLANQLSEWQTGGTHASFCDLRSALTAAQDRVRELEKNNARLTDVSMHRARLLAQHGIKETLGPIADPTQGVVARPACVPADCQHFEKLPSGLWAWVQDGDVFFEASESYVVHSGMVGIDYEALGNKYRAHIDKSDFLAARALGVRVLGWKS